MNIPQPHRSCTASGWWEQKGYGRQQLSFLSLTFLEEGKFIGFGEDIIGPFTMDGVITPKSAVVIIKQYTGHSQKHSVHYAGIYTGEGVLTGTWFTQHDEGPWEIRLGRPDGPVDVRELSPGLSELPSEDWQSF